MLGFLNINKPPGVTAHDVVSSVRKIMRIKRVGHGGTLDPLATGVLPVAVGGACRLLRYLDGRKIYLADVLLGTSTATDDLEGEVIAVKEQLPDEKDIERAVASFVGRLSQIPPGYSAVHHGGERLYNLARQGRLPEDIAARQVVVHSIEITAVALPVVQLRVACGAGTYIRALARDLGRVLGCGGCLKNLVREAAGPFRLESALSLAELQELRSRGQERSALLSPVNLLGLPCVKLEAAQVRLLRMGQSVPAAEELADNALPVPGGSNGEAGEEAVIVTCEEELIAVCRKTGDMRLRPEVVMSYAD